MTNPYLKSIAVLVPSLLFLLVSSCDDIAPTPVNEEELITTLILTFTDPSSSDTYVWRAEDTDGDGGVDVVATDTLPSNTALILTVRVRNDIENEEITEEIAAEDEDHLFCFEVNGLSMTIQPSDTDGNGQSIGLVSSVNTGAAGSGNVTVQLKHLPVKTASSPCATGEADVDYTFQGVVVF